MTKRAELAFSSAPMKRPPLPKLAERARAQEWSYERFCELCCRQVASAKRTAARAGSGAARFPARKTLDELDFAFERSVQKTLLLHLGQLDFPGMSCPQN